MKVRGTVDFDVAISEREAKRIAIEVIEKLRNWIPGYIVRDGNVCAIKTYATSHTWEETNIIRPATQEDVFTYNLIQDILNSF